MLTLLLVWTVALGSLAIFVAGMIFPELSRKNDLIWVGVGLFYSLILWANAGSMGGGLVLGQTAGVSMMVWLGVQTMTQRRELTSEDKKTPVPDWLQKIVDFVLPLWEKGYTAIAGQLGIETETQSDGVDAGEESGGLNDLKAKFLGFLDKLNNSPADTDIPVASNDLDDDWDEETEDSAESSDASPESEAQSAVEVDSVESVAEEAEEVVAEQEDVAVAAQEVIEDTPAAEAEPEVDVPVENNEEPPVAVETASEEVSESMTEAPSVSEVDGATQTEAVAEAEPDVAAASEVETEPQEEASPEPDVAEVQPEVDAQQPSEGVDPFTPEKLHAMAEEVAPSQPEVEASQSEAEEPSNLEAPPAYQDQGAVNTVAEQSAQESQSSENSDASDDGQEESNWPPEPMN